MRDESADVLAQAIEGFRQTLGVDNGTLTRYIQRECANPVEMVALFLRTLPSERGALLLAYLENVYEEAHGAGDDASLEDLFVALDAQDNREDGIRFLAAHSHYTEGELRQWLRENREYDHIADRTRRVVARRLSEMRKPAGRWARVNGNGRKVVGR